MNGFDRSERNGGQFCKTAEQQDIENKSSHSDREDNPFPSQQDGCWMMRPFSYDSLCQPKGKKDDEKPKELISEYPKETIASHHC